MRRFVSIFPNTERPRYEKGRANPVGADWRAVLLIGVVGAIL